MAKAFAETTFVVITGSNPEAGKRLRIRQVRSHITTGYYRRQQEQQNQQQQRRRQYHVLIRAAPSPSSIMEMSDPGDDDNTLHIPPSVHAPIPFTCSPLLNPDFLDAEMTRRLLQLFDVHMHTNMKRSPGSSTVLRWAATTPSFMSAKLLQVSAWDDIRDTGVLSKWAVRQRAITTRLLDNDFSEGVKLDMCVIVCTIQALLGFELLTGNDENFSRLNDFCQSLINQYAQPNTMVWEYLIVGLTLTEKANRLRIADRGRLVDASSQADPFWQFQSQPDFAFPMDAALFTFGQPASEENNGLIYLLLGNLYHVVSIAASSQQRKVNRPIYENVVSQRMRMLSDISSSDSKFERNNTVDPRILPLQLSIFIVASCLLFGAEGDKKNTLAESASQLRSRLIKLEVESQRPVEDLRLFPGALVWCYAIGARFSYPLRDQKWFLMQFVRTTHTWIPEGFDHLPTNSKMIVSCLEGIEKLDVEGMAS